MYGTISNKLFINKQLILQSTFIIIDHQSINPEFTLYMLSIYEPRHVISNNVTFWQV